jgi:hypothetical protein
MFDSEILDVVIGMVFIFLLLSLICSAVNEIIEAKLKNRAGDLERGIKELLNDPSGAGLTEKIYQHPLISSLYRGKYVGGESGKKGKKAKASDQPDLPSYIPARNFALALMDIILPPQQGSADGAKQASRSGAAGATTASATAPAGTTPAVPHSVQSLRNAIDTSPLLQANDTVRKGLLTLVDAAGDDAAKARQNIEAWFNSSMDRVSGWYKRRSQVIVLVLGFLITVAVNADAIAIATSLSHDKAMRDSLVVAAQEYAKANASPSPTPTASPTASPTPTPSPNTTPSPKALPSTSVQPSPAAGSSVAPPGLPSPTASTSPNALASPTASPSPTLAACKKDENSPVCLACKKDENSPECRVAKNLEQIQSLGLPLGWNERTTPHDFLGFLLKLLGWLLTAAAISLGAPFWFDMLNKFIVIRSTVKPREKSHEEPSKD